MKTIFYQKGQSLIGIIVVLVAVGLITGGLYLYLSKQIPEISEITQKPTGETGEIVKPEKEEIVPEEKTKEIEGQVSCKREITKTGVTCGGIFYEDYCENFADGTGYADVHRCGALTGSSCSSLVTIDRTFCPNGCQNGVCLSGPSQEVILKLEKPVNQKCTDGTPDMQCSITKPLYCQNLKLVNACMTCGCPEGMTCQQDNSCIKEEVVAPPTIEPIIFALNKEYANKFPNWKQEADEIINKINSVFAKSTSKQFKINKYLVYNDSEYTNLFTNSEDYPEYYQDVSNRGGLTYILLVHKSGISNQEMKQLYGSDNVNLAWTVYKGGKRYPALLQGNSESRNILLDEFRSVLISMPVHEIGHYLGLGVPDWYLYEYSDCTGINPKFSDYSLREDPNFSKDPMSGLQIDADIMRFNELNSTIINKNLNFKYTYDDVRTNWFSKITKVYVTNRNGTPIPDATVKIFCARKGCWYCGTQCSGATYPTGVPKTSVPEQTLLTDKNGYATYNGPVGAWEMSESQNSPCIARAIKVYYEGKSNVKVVNFIDLQKNYVLNNSNEHITHIILE